MTPGSYRYVWWNRLRRTSLAAMLTALSQFAFAGSDYAAAWGPSTGSTVPLLAALDQNGQQQNLETLRGTNGLLFVFNRSVDW